MQWEDNFEKRVRNLVGTSADDCKTSLNFVTDGAVLAEALKRAEATGQKTKAKYIAARIKASSPSAARLAAGTPANPNSAALPLPVVASWISASGPTMLCAVPQNPASRQNGRS